MNNTLISEENKTDFTKEQFYKMIFSAEGRDEKRSLLKSFSKAAKQIIENNPDCEEMTVNDVILEKMYKNHEHCEFHTFKGWKEKGFKVVKGSKAFFVWSKPRKVEKVSEGETEQDESLTREYEFFGIANLFSNAQVELIHQP